MSSPTPDHLAELARVQRDFLATIPVVDPDAAVPSCGRWRVRDLVVHLARIHHWAAAQARGVTEVPLGRGPFALEPLYRDCAAELLRALTDLAPDAVVRTLLGPGPAAFWARRQLHETLVHLWDLRTAGGLDLDVPAEVWADTVDEVVTVMQPRQVRLGRMAPLPAAVDLVATDAGRRWRLAAVDDDGSAFDDDASAVRDDASTADDAAAAEVRGPASTLALLLWGRATPDDAGLVVTGDRAALDAALDEPLTP